MNGKLKVLLLLVLSGSLLVISPGTRLYSANDVPSDPDRLKSASIQFILLHIENETLEQLMNGTKVTTLDSIPLEKIGGYIQAGEGAEIISQTKLTVLDGHEGQMTVVENERRKTKNADEGNSEQGRREMEIFVRIKTKIQNNKELFADFAYKRSLMEEGFYAGEKEEEEEGVEQKFELSSGIVLNSGKACIAGVNIADNLARLLIVKADFR